MHGDLHMLTHVLTLTLIHTPHSHMPVYTHTLTHTTHTHTHMHTRRMLPDRLLMDLHFSKPFSLEVKERKAVSSVLTAGKGSSSLTGEAAPDPLCKLKVLTSWKAVCFPPPSQVQGAEQMCCSSKDNRGGINLWLWEE